MMEIIRSLETTRAETLAMFELDETRLARCYAPGKWSIRFILHHLADAETVLFERIRRILSEPRQVLWANDQDAWARALDYESRPLQLSRSLYDATRAGVIYYAGIHYEKSGHLEFVHSETGVRTLKDEIDKVANHNAHHLEQIHAALEHGSPATGVLLAESRF
jgi:hypothetical protein